MPMIGAVTFVLSLNSVIFSLATVPTEPLAVNCAVTVGNVKLEPPGTWMEDGSSSSM